MRRRQDVRLSLILAAAVAAVLSIPGSSSAEDVGLRAQQFEPNADGLGYFTAESARVGELGRVIFNVHMNYATGVVGMWNGDQLQSWPVRKQLGVDLQIGMGFRVADVVVLVPFSPYQEGSGITGAEFSLHPFGDVVVRPKVQALNPDVRKIGLAFALPISFPSGNAGALYGEPGVTVSPTAIGELRVGPLDIAVNLGVLGRKTTSIEGLEVGAQFQYKVALRLRPTPALGFQVELWGLSGDNVAASPANWLGGLNVATKRGFVFRAGVGTGIGAGYGSPKVRFVFGIGACTPAGEKTDSDRDGVADEYDECPEKPEDVDGFADGDGCPESDNDGDGLADVADECPNDRETRNGFQDEDGCPDVAPEAEPPAPAPPVVEPTPAAAEPPSIVSAYEPPVEEAPPVYVPPVVPPPVSDPMDRVDVEALPDDSGIDDPDWLLGDLDDIDWGDDFDIHKDDEDLDVSGSWDGWVEVDRGAGVLRLERGVWFESQTANFEADSIQVLDRVADLMAARPDLERIEIQGHTTERDGATSNRILSQRRGDAVANHLIARGVEANRLVAVGYGSARPVDGPSGEQRIEFHILD